MGDNEVEFLVDEPGVRESNSILQFSHPELSGNKEEPVDLTEQLNFSNIHNFAHHLVMTNDSLATQLLDELLYWREQGRA